MPAFFPEGDTPVATDPSNKSLQKINSLLQQIEAKTGATTISGPVTVTNEVEVKNDSGNPIPIKEGFSIPEYDQILLSNYDGNGNAGTVVYRKNNAAVATLTLSYNQANQLTSVTKS
jgi:hypothetical protein